MSGDGIMRLDGLVCSLQEEASAKGTLLRCYCSVVLNYRIVDQANIFICLYESEVCSFLQANT
jgi:hypothetical protein